MKLKEHYTNEVADKLYKELDLKNKHLIPKIQKVVLNIGCGEGATSKAIVEHVLSAVSYTHLDVYKRQL